MTTTTTTTAHTRGYSEFFASGIRVVSRRFATPRIDAIKPFPLTFDASNPGADLTAKRRTSRPTSMVITLPNSAMINGHTKVQQRQRRSSLISFSSRLFGRKPQSIPNEESGWVSSATDSTSSFHDSLGFWDMGGSPGAVWSFPSCPNGGIEHPQPLDPFSPSPSSKSFFVDLQDTPKRTTSLSSTASSSSSSSFFSRKRDSFLHITSTPPPDASFLHFPRNRRSKGHDKDSSHHTQQRPVSIHSIPIASLSKETTATTTMTTSANANPTAMTTAPSPPSNTHSARSREPSFLSNSSSISIAIPESTNPAKDSKDTTKLTSSVEEEPIINAILGEEEAPVSATDAQIFFSRDDDVPASVDWRQFHIELLAVSS